MLHGSMGGNRRKAAETWGDPLLSAHWFQDAAVTVSTSPKTIQDFGGFPQELCQVQYLLPLLPGQDAKRGSDNGQARLSVI